MDITIYTDGACSQGSHENCTWIMGYSFVIEEYSKDGVITRKHINKDIGKGTNNIAEYIGLIEALVYFYDYYEVLRAYKDVNLKIFSDSDLMVNQVNGRWKAKDEKLKVLCDRARSLLKRYTWKLSWVPREENKAGHLL